MGATEIRLATKAAVDTLISTGGSVDSRNGISVGDRLGCIREYLWHCERQDEEYAEMQVGGGIWFARGEDSGIARLDYGYRAIARQAGWSGEGGKDTGRRFGGILLAQ